MNDVSLVGRLTKDPELKYISGSGTAVCNFTLAVDKQLSKAKKKEFEQQGKPTADFIRIVVWGKQGENVANYCSKGQLVSVSGSIRTSSDRDSNGNVNYYVDVVAFHVGFLSYSNNNQQNSQQNQQNNQQGNQYNNSEAFTEKELQDMLDSDDIPF